MQNEAPQPTSLPPAWQPITFRGVASFAFARIGRLLVFQSLVALLAAAAVCWFLSSVWFPTIRQAIRQLPDTGSIENGQLTAPPAPPAMLAETRFLAVFLDPDGGSPVTSVSDLRFEFRRTHFAVCGAVGCHTRPYPADRVLPFNRSDLESTWGAWQPMLFGFALLGVFAAVFATWLVLATVYFPIPWLVAYFNDHRLSLPGAWKLSAAALLPGALLITLGIVLYGLALISLVQFTLMWAAHLPLGWVYLACAPRRLPRVDNSAPPRSNPFGEKQTEEVEEAPEKSKSPFSTPVSN